ncbi:MAG: methyl-accepting chemotaxis protein, partial [Methylobacter sp.]
VAGEVRSLAQRAAASAGEIKTLIEDTVKKIDDGSELAANAGFTMKEILNAIRGVTGMMSEITAASVEQSAGIEQINLAISQMDYVTQQNAALVEQAASAAESLEEQAQNLSITVSDFRLHDSPVSSNAFYAAATALHPSHHREHKEQTIWNTIRTTKNNTLHNFENAAAAAKAKVQLLAVANDDWEEF